jgi:hypothetical protein
MRRSDGDAPHQTNQFLCVILIHYNRPGIIIIMPGSQKKNGIDGESTNQLLDNSSGTGDRKPKCSCIAALAAVTHSIVGSLLTSTLTLNLSSLTSTPTSNLVDDVDDQFRQWRRWQGRWRTCGSFVDDVVDLLYRRWHQ